MSTAVYNDFDQRESTTLSANVQCGMRIIDEMRRCAAEELDHQVEGSFAYYLDALTNAHSNRGRPYASLRHALEEMRGMKVQEENGRHFVVLPHYPLISGEAATKVYLDKRETRHEGARLSDTPYNHGDAVVVDLTAPIWGSRDPLRRITVKFCSAQPNQKKLREFNELTMRQWIEGAKREMRETLGMTRKPEPAFV